MSGSAWMKTRKKEGQEAGGAIKAESLSLRHRGNTHRLRRLDGHKLVVTLLPTDVAEGPVVPGVLGDVADLVDRVVMEEHLRNTRRRRFNTRPYVPALDRESRSTLA